MNDIPSPAASRLAPSRISLPGAVEGAAPPPPPRRSWLGQRWRLLAALLLLALAAVALLRQHIAVSTEHAVISAYAIPMRTPIGGELTQMAAQPGALLPVGAVLGHVANHLADRRFVLDAEAERARAASEAAALASQIAALDALAAGLGARAEEHRQAASRMLAAGLEEGLRLQAAAEARLRRLDQDAARALDLARGGVASPALRERAEAERDAAREEAAALAARGEALRAQDRAALSGLYLTGGFGGVGYLEQRLDEIALRRAELGRQLAVQEAAADRAAQRLAAEIARLHAVREALLVSPGDWHVWQVLAKSGQRVLAEDVVAELLDCRDAFILAALPQAEAPWVAPGQQARLRLAGESTELLGTVTGWVPEGMAREGGRLAVLPTRPRGNSQLLQIALDAPPRGAACPVGRTGRVVMERSSRLPDLGSLRGLLPTFDMRGQP